MQKDTFFPKKYIAILKGGENSPPFRINDKLGFIELFAQTKSIKSFAELFQKATEGTGRVALYSAFLLLAFLCASCVKEKRLNPFAIKT